MERRDAPANAVWGFLLTRIAWPLSDTANFRSPRESAAAAEDMDPSASKVTIIITQTPGSSGWCRSQLASTRRKKKKTVRVTRSLEPTIQMPALSPNLLPPSIMHQPLKRASPLNGCGLPYPYVFDLPYSIYFLFYQLLFCAGTIGNRKPER